MQAGHLRGRRGCRGAAGRGPTIVVGHPAGPQRAHGRNARDLPQHTGDGEQARRDARMIERLKGGSLPYTPEVMSWLSAKLDKPAKRISQDEVASLIG